MYPAELDLTPKVKISTPGEKTGGRERALNYHRARAGLRYDKDPGKELGFFTLPRKTRDLPLQAIPSYLNLCCSSFSAPHILLARSSFSDFPSSSWPPHSACSRVFCFSLLLPTCTFSLFPTSTTDVHLHRSPFLNSHAVCLSHCLADTPLSRSSLPLRTMLPKAKWSFFKKWANTHWFIGYSSAVPANRSARNTGFLMCFFLSSQTKSSCLRSYWQILSCFSYILPFTWSHLVQIFLGYSSSLPTACSCISSPQSLLKWKWSRLVVSDSLRPYGL